MSAAIARAKAKRKLKADNAQKAVIDNVPSKEASVTFETESSAKPAGADSKKAKIAAAIAKAKAKKNKETKPMPMPMPDDMAAIASVSTAENRTQQSVLNQASAIDDKKAKVAAAIAKAKAKQMQQRTSAADSIVEIGVKPSGKTKVAKQQPKEQSKEQADSDIREQEPVLLDKKAKIAAAIAKAKAKKKLKEATAGNDESPNNISTTKQTDESI